MEGSTFLGKITGERWFAVSEFSLVIASGIALYLCPQIGGGALIFPLLPWCIRLISGQFPFRRTVFDWLIAIYVITAAIGYWAAYDKISALHKFWLIVASVLLYYALSGQPRENLVWISAFFFTISIGVSIYFFLTHDFVALPRKLEFVNHIGLWIMQVRPSVEWEPVHPNYVAGIAAITVPFVFHLAWKLHSKTAKAASRALLFFLMLLGMGIVMFAIIMTTSRGVWLALAAAAGVCFLWKVISISRSSLWRKNETSFSILVLGYLALVILALYAGPASITGSTASPSFYGSGNRAELFERGLYFVRDFPFTGGGLDAFPGLYSYYMLGIPFYNVPNSHNLFLDVAIEQGLLAGISFLVLFLGSVWFVSRSIIRTSSLELKIFGWITLFSLIIAIIHGMVDDYLYNENGTLLALSLAGISMIARNEQLTDIKPVSQWNFRVIGFVVLALISVCILNLNKIRSAWYADIGSVQMAQVELLGFPTNGWAGQEIIPQLEMAETSFHSALQYDQSNETANHRLGLIAMLRRDFKSASANLEVALEAAPGHRGIIKNLGYCYAWLGEMDQAKALLENIPEAEQELDVYIWWWGMQGRADLADNASQILFLLGNVP